MRRVHDVVQGTQKWHALRSRHYTASEAPAMMGVSKYESRNDLLRRKLLGEEPTGNEFLFERGRRAEQNARPQAEMMLGELYPVTMTAEVEGLPLLASLDGITEDGSVIWENKLKNAETIAFIKEHGDLPEYHVWQVEHQLLVSGAQSAFFTVSDEVGEIVELLIYQSKPERREALIKGWQQFHKELTDPAIVDRMMRQTEKPKAEKVDGFGDLVLSLRVEGRVVAANIKEFKAAAEQFIARLPRPDALESDEDFATAEIAAKACADAESRIKEAKEIALSQMSDVYAVLRAADDIAEEIRQARIALEKAVKARKEEIRKSAVAEATARVANHYKAIGKDLGEYAPEMPASVSGNLLAAIKGVKTLKSLHDRLDDAVAKEIISANDLAERIRRNAEIIENARNQHGDLFADARFIAQLDETEVQKIVAERVAAKERTLQQELQKRNSQETSAPSEPSAPSAPKAKIKSLDRVTVSAINRMIDPLAISCNGIAALGIPVAEDGTIASDSVLPLLERIKSHIEALARAMEQEKAA